MTCFSTLPSDHNLQEKTKEKVKRQNPHVSVTRPTSVTVSGLLGGRQYPVSSRPLHTLEVNTRGMTSFPFLSM